VEIHFSVARLVFLFLRVRSAANYLAARDALGSIDAEYGNRAKIGAIVGSRFCLGYLNAPEKVGLD
jgi:hypothetical protein